jgi:hypothetical protein
MNMDAMSKYLEVVGIVIRDGFVTNSCMLPMLKASPEKELQTCHVPLLVIAEDTPLGWYTLHPQNESEEYELVPDLPVVPEDPLWLLTPLNPDLPLNPEIPLPPEDPLNEE